MNPRPGTADVRPNPSTADDTSLRPSGFGSVTGLPGLPPGFRDEFASRYVDVDGVRLHIVLGGAGPAVLLIGGWPQFWWEWRYIMQPLAEGHTVIAVDPRGIGLSDRPADGYDTGTVGAELHRLMRILGHVRFDVIGHDVGMWIAYAMAADDAAPISRLVLMEAALPGISAAPSALPDTQKEVDAAWHFLFNRLASLNEHLIRDREEAYLNAQFRIKAATPDAMPPEAIDVYLRAQRQPDALRGSLAYYRALDITIPQNRERARTLLTTPVLAIGGAASRGDLVGADARTIAANVTARSIPHAGHYLPEEAPRAVTAEVNNFINDNI